MLRKSLLALTVAAFAALPLAASAQYNGQYNNGQYNGQYNNGQYNGQYDNGRRQNVNNGRWNTNTTTDNSRRDDHGQGR